MSLNTLDVVEVKQATPGARVNYVAQLMSGSRHPSESGGTAYTNEDFHKIAHYIYAKITPPQIFQDLIAGYNAIPNDEKKLYLHNVEIFVHELINADVHKEFSGAVKDGIKAFMQLKAGAPPEIQSDFDDLQNSANVAFERINQKNEQHYARVREMREPTYNKHRSRLDNFLHENLATVSCCRLQENLLGISNR